MTSPRGQLGSLALGFAVTLGGCTCASSHERDAAPERADASSDGLRGEIDGASCELAPPDLFGDDCPPDAAERCAAWAAIAAGPGLYGHSACPGGGSFCGLGDVCSPAGPHWPGLCVCDDRGEVVECRRNEVCVSDTPDGPRRCVAACAWTRP